MVHFLDAWPVFFRLKASSQFNSIFSITRKRMFVCCCFSCIFAQKYVELFSYLYILHFFAALFYTEAYVALLNRLVTCAILLPTKFLNVAKNNTCNFERLVIEKKLCHLCCLLLSMGDSIHAIL